MDEQLWGFIGLCIFSLLLFLAMRRVRDRGNGKIADWLRKIFPKGGQ